VLAFAPRIASYLPQQLRASGARCRAKAATSCICPRRPRSSSGGRIGSEVARLASAFGMNVIGVDERRTAPPPGVAELHRAAALNTLPAAGRFRDPHRAAYAETEGFMNRERFQKMKRSAFFIQYRARHDDTAG